MSCGVAEAHIMDKLGEKTKEKIRSLTADNGDALDRFFKSYRVAQKFVPEAETPGESVAQESIRDPASAEMRKEVKFNAEKLGVVNLPGVNEFRTCSKVRKHYLFVAAATMYPAKDLGKSTTGSTSGPH